MGEATYQLVQDFSHQQYHHILSHIWYHINFNNSPNHGPKKLHKSYTCFVLFFITQIHLYLFVNIYIYIFVYGFDHINKHMFVSKNKVDGFFMVDYAFTIFF